MLFINRPIIFLFFFYIFFSFKVYANDNLIEKVYSILSVKFITNDFVANRIDSKYNCKLFFRDDYKEKVEVIGDEDSNYLTLISNPGKIYLEYISCYNHKIPFIFGKSRKKYIEDWGFVAHKDFLNYAGEITINFDTSSFMVLDLLNLSDLLEDSGKIRFDVTDNSNQILNFINYKFVHLRGQKLIKSLFVENRKLQPNEFNKNDIIENSTQFFYQKNDQENNYKNIQFENNVKLNQNDFNQINEDLNKNRQNNSVKKPIHPYLAPIYSDHYNPTFNPFNAINLSSNPYLTPSTEIQDPAIDRYYFDDEIKNLDLK
ncbi:MAG: hypothetical protein ACKO6C_00975 [Alphaproteobacteria bacterium]